MWDLNFSLISLQSPHQLSRHEKCCQISERLCGIPSLKNLPCEANETIDLNDLNEKTIQHNFSDQEGRLVCLICYKIFKRNNFDFFKAHFKTHPQTLWPRIEIIKSAVKKCENCDYTCKDTAQLNAHSKIHLQKRFTCLSCRRDFGSEKIMKRHSCVSNRQCQICHHIFSDSTRLKYHMKVHTGTNKRFECEMCAKSESIIECISEDIY